MVFLAGAAVDAVGTCGGSALLVAAHEGCCCVLHDHKATLYATVCSEKHGKSALAQAELVDAALAYAAPLCTGNFDVIKDQGKGLAMEMTGRNAVARIGKNQGIVGYRAGLGLKHPQGMAPSVSAGSVNLGHAAKRVGILNVGFSVMPPGRTFGPSAYASRYPYLAVVRTQGMNTFLKGRGHSVVGK